jgi:hypothetical protein
VHYLEQLDFAVRAVRTEDVDVDLPVLASPAALRSLVAVAADSGPS